jgi:hypothetical protein
MDSCKLGWVVIESCKKSGEGSELYNNYRNSGMSIWACWEIFFMRFQVQTENYSQKTLFPW